MVKYDSAKGHANNSSKHEASVICRKNRDIYSIVDVHSVYGHAHPSCFQLVSTAVKDAVELGLDGRFRRKLPYAHQSIVSARNRKD